MNQNGSTIQIKLNLLENALDFILKGIDELFDQEYRLVPIEPADRSAILKTAITFHFLSSDCDLAR